MTARKTTRSTQSRNSNRATRSNNSVEPASAGLISPAALMQSWAAPWQAAQVIQQVQAQLFQRTASTLLEAIEKVRAAQTPLETMSAQAEFCWASWMSGMQATSDIVQAMGRMRNGQGEDDDFAHPSPPLYAPASTDAFVRH